MGLEVVMKYEDSRESTEIRRVSVIFDESSSLPDLVNMCPSDGDSSESDCSEVMTGKECSNVSTPLHEANRSINNGMNEIQTRTQNSVSRFPFYQPQLLSCFDCGSESTVIDDDLRDTSVPDLSQEPDDGSIFQIFSRMNESRQTLPPMYRQDSLKQAFQMGLVAYFLSPKKKLPQNVLIENYYSSRWNGHLPLAPMSDNNISNKRSLRRSRKRYRHRSSYDSSFPCDLALENVDQCNKFSLNNSHLVTSYVSHICNLNETPASAAVNPPPAPPEKTASSGGSGVQQGMPARSGTITQSFSIPPDASSATRTTGQRVSHQNAALTNQPLTLIGSPASCMKELPALRDAPPNKREELFIKKLQLCGVIFSFDDPTSDKRGKDMKRQTLLELVDYVNTPAGQKIFTESVMADLMAMVSANVCRALPPATDDFDPEEDEPVLEPAWPHLQVAYEFFLRFIVSSEVNAKAAKKYVDQRFCLQLVELFDSEDPRERDYLKTILHRIYGKFMSHRSFIRRAISNVFYRFVYETERHNGIGELLEILGSIINGFAIPLKKEHLQFLVRALIPLHKPKCVGLYHQQLSYCIIQYVEKDADTATPILNGFFQCWPWSCSGKQVLFLNELEEILELLGADQLAQISHTLFTNLARCLDSDHFQVVERALFLWNNEHLVNSGCLSRLNAPTVLPIIYGPLYKNSSGHWNATVEGLAQNVLKMYMEYDLVLYDKCTTAHFKEEDDAKRKIDAISERWSQIEALAQENGKQNALTDISAQVDALKI